MTNDYKYALSELVKAVEGFTKVINEYPKTESTFKRLEKADHNLVRAMSLSKDILNK